MSLLKVIYMKFLVEPEYRVRDFGDVEAEYLEMFNCTKGD